MNVIAKPNEIISAKDKETFERDGFIVIRNFLSSEEVQALKIGYDQVIRGELDVEPWRHLIKPNAVLQLQHPSQYIPGWADHPFRKKMLAVAKALNGNDLDHAYDQLIYKPPHNTTETLWHQDAAYGWKGSANERAVTCWLALVDVTKEMGSLRFIPGSHKQGIYQHEDASARNKINLALEAVGFDIEKQMAVDYKAGDVTFHHGRTLHYTSGNHTDFPRCGLATHLHPKTK